jgi:GntR family transcriptional repressor for pyruvate dehydrogenase complex
MAFEKIDIPSPREIFIKEIEGRIIKGKLAVGEKLPTERELEAQTGITKSVIHFALKDLENMGFLRVEPRKGVYVADYAKEGSFQTLNEILRYNGGRMSYKMSVEIVELRNAIEGGAMIRLATNHTDEDIKKLRDSLDEVRTAVDKDIEISELADITSRFHALICDLSGNDMFALMMNAFSPMSKVLWENCAFFWGAEGFLEQDTKIIELIEQGKGREAQAYIEDIFAQFLKAFNSMR